VIGAHPKAGLVSGMYMLVFEKQLVFCADTTVNIDPTAEQLAQIAYSASRITRTMGMEPRIAMLSFSNFGSVRHPETGKDGARGAVAAPAGSLVDGRRGNAGGYRVRSRDHRARLSVQHAQGPGERP
jgi:hypothetical protein